MPDGDDEDDELLPPNRVDDAAAARQEGVVSLQGGEQGLSRRGIGGDPFQGLSHGTEKSGIEFPEVLENAGKVEEPTAHPRPLRE